MVELKQIRHGDSHWVQMLFFRNFCVEQAVTHTLPYRYSPLVLLQVVQL